MRVQLQGQALRLRIDEAELARLLAGETVTNATYWPDGDRGLQQLILGSDNGWHRADDGWRVTLADADVRALAARLPSREGLRVEIAGRDGTRLKVLFDVDVRDSTHRRFPGKIKPTS